MTTNSASNRLNTADRTAIAERADALAKTVRGLSEQGAEIADLLGDYAALLRALPPQPPAARPVPIFKSGDRVESLDGDEDDDGVVKRVSKDGQKILIEQWLQPKFETAPKLRKSWRWAQFFRLKARTISRLNDRGD
jgi:hypothetical protein